MGHEETHALRQTKLESRQPKATAVGVEMVDARSDLASSRRPESDPGRALGCAHPLAKPLKQRSPAASRLDGRAARCGHQGGDPRAIFGSVAVDAAQARRVRTK
jgi:hypothetical protein